MIKLIQKNMFHQMPWKNGRGTTTEIAKFPEDSGDDFVWRMSMADIKESGPFSSFPGIVRSIVLLEGPPVQLHHPHMAPDHELTLLSPYEFDGEWKTHADVAGPGRDFNLMCRKGPASGGVLSHTVMSPNKVEHEIRSKVFGVFCTEGKLKVQDHALEKYDLLLALDENIAVTVESIGERAKYLLLEITLPAHAGLK